MTAPEKHQEIQEIQEKLRSRRLDEKSFLSKLKTHAFRLGKPAIKQLYALYFLLKSPATPKRSKLIIIAALLYFVSPFDSIPDLLGPLGFTDDLAVIALVFSQLKSHMSEDILVRAKEAADRLIK